MMGSVNNQHFVAALDLTMGTGWCLDLVSCCWGFAFEIFRPIQIYKNALLCRFRLFVIIKRDSERLKTKSHNNKWSHKHLMGRTELWCYPLSEWSHRGGSDTSQHASAGDPPSWPLITSQPSNTIWRILVYAYITGFHWFQSGILLFFSMKAIKRTVV